MSLASYHCSTPRSDSSVAIHTFSIRTILRKSTPFSRVAPSWCGRARLLPSRRASRLGRSLALPGLDEPAGQHAAGAVDVGPTAVAPGHRHAHLLAQGVAERSPLGIVG